MRVLLTSDLISHFHLWTTSHDVRCMSVTAKASEFQQDAAEITVLRSKYEEAQAMLAEVEHELQLTEQVKGDALSQTATLTDEIDVLRRHVDVAKTSELAAKADLKVF